MSFPFSGRTVEAYRGKLPQKAEVVVIGGGVIGISAALSLAGQGISVVVVEKGLVGAEQSSRNWGWLRTQGRAEPEIPIAQEAQRLWANLAPQLDCDIGLSQVGTLYLAQDEADLGRYEDWHEMAKPYGVASQLCGPAEIAQHLPGATRSWVGGIFTATDGRAEPWQAVPAMGRYARKLGVRIFEGCAVRTLDIAAGRVAGVVTEAGRIAASSVILAGGAWSSLFLRNHGITLPQLCVRATVGATQPLSEVNPGPVGQPGLAWRRRDDGGYTIAPSRRENFHIGPDAFRHLWAYRKVVAQQWRGLRFHLTSPKGFPDGWRTRRSWGTEDTTPFEAMRILDPPPDLKELQRTADRLAKLFPALGAVNVDAAWAGMIDTMPDEVPVVDQVATLPGLTIATGMSGHGFGVGPAFGRIAAELATGAAPDHDLSAFRLARFD